jgi:NTE family protein
MGVSDAAFSLAQPAWIDPLQDGWMLQWSPFVLAADMATRMFSPYEINPLNLNPLRRVLEAAVDFAALRRPDAPVKLFLSATNVRTGRLKVFQGREISADAVLASACLPSLFHAVEIGGEAYWDGGYVGNPALFPLIRGCESRDLVVVHASPTRRAEVPRAARGILDRASEIGFGSSLWRELRAVAFVNALVEDGEVREGRLKRVFVHAIAADEVMEGLGAHSALNTSRVFLRQLRDAGRRHAGDWLERCHADLGVRSTVDLSAEHL